MYPCHDRLAPCRPSQSECFIPHLPFVFFHLLYFFPFFLFSTLLILIVSWSPFVLSTLVYELLTCLLECRYGIKGKLVIGIYSCSRSRNNHVTELLVGFDKVFGDGIGDSDEVRFEVFRVLDYEGRVDDCGEGLVGEVTAGRIG